MARPDLERWFLLSPAFLGGRRGSFLLHPDADSSLAQRLRSAEGASVAEVYTYVSGLYFRGKITYAEVFASPPGAVRVITPTRGLQRPGAILYADDLREFAALDIVSDDPAYRLPLERDARELAAAHPDAEFVLLGSIATGKYATILLEPFGGRLLFPADFVGRGDMSRGGLLLRAARAGEELEYVPVRGTVRRGARPPRLPPRG